MNLGRRQFLKAALLVPLALATKVQETRSAEDVLLEVVNQSGWTSGDQVFCFSPSEAFAEIGNKVFEGYAEGVRRYPSDVDEYGEPNWKLETFGNSWSSENCDPIADLQAVHDWIYEDRGLERQPLLMSKRFEHLFSERDKLSMRFI